MSDRRDVSGVWYGSFTAADPAVDANAFIALLTERSGSIDGTITEPDIRRRTDLLRAFARGARAGPVVRFTKQYDGSGRVAHAVRYSGRIDDAGKEISGEWRFARYSGAFVMTRETFAAEELEDEVGEAVSAGQEVMGFGKTTVLTFPLGCAERAPSLSQREREGGAKRRKGEGRSNDST